MEKADNTWTYVDTIRQHYTSRVFLNYAQTPSDYNGGLTFEQYTLGALSALGNTISNVIERNRLGLAQTPIKYCDDGDDIDTGKTMCSTRRQKGTWKGATHKCAGLQGSGWINSGTYCYKNPYTPHTRCPEGTVYDSLGTLCYPLCPQGTHWNQKSTPTFCISNS